MDGHKSDVSGAIHHVATHFNRGTFRIVENTESPNHIRRLRLNSERYGKETHDRQSVYIDG